MRIHVDVRLRGMLFSGGGHGGERGTGVGRGKGGKRERNAKRYLLSFLNALQYFKKTRTQMISDLH